MTSLRLALLTALLGLAGCSPTPEVVRPEDLRTTLAGATALVVVYSRTGFTAQAARGFAKALQADYQRVQGDGTEGGSWFSTPSWRDRVKTTPETLDLSAYQLVLIGGPVWYWRPNAVTSSFLRGADLTGKDVVLFYTFEGGAISDAALDQWKAWVAERGGKVLDVVGIDRSKLPKDRTLEDEAARIALEKRWRSPQVDHP